MVTKITRVRIVLTPYLALKNYYVKKLVNASLLQIKAKVEIFIKIDHV